jgi:ParB/RepB/Spo0J family partition protein
MGASFSSDTISRSQSMYVDYPENILIEPELNGRHEHTEIEDLAADIEKNGQMSPVGIRKNDQGEAVLVYGHRRYRAVMLLNKRNKKNPRKLICNYFAVDETEAFAMAIRENRQRCEVGPLDDCANITTMMRRFAKTAEDIAVIYFPESGATPENIKWVKQRAALIELAPESQQAVRDGKVKITAAVGLAKLSKDAQRAKLTAPAAPKTPKPAKATPAPAVLDFKLRELVTAALEDVSQSTLNDDERRYVEVDRELLLKVWEYLTGLTA